MLKVCEWELKGDEDKFYWKSKCGMKFRFNVNCIPKEACVCGRGLSIKNEDLLRVKAMRM